MIIRRRGFAPTWAWLDKLDSKQKSTSWVIFALGGEIFTTKLLDSKPWVLMTWQEYQSY